MIPQIINLGPIPVNSFGLMVALAFFAAMLRLSVSFERNGLDPALAERYVFVGGIAGLLGARIWYVITHPMILERGFWYAFVSGAGFVWYGGLLFAIAALIIFCRKDRIALHSFFDATGPTMVLAYAIGRVGCQLSGDGDYGIATNSWLAMAYPNGVVPTPPGVEVYPTPVFESLVMLAYLPLLTWAEKHSWWRVPWRRLGLYFVLVSIERFFIEFIRINPVVAWGLSEAQLVAVALTLIGLVLIFYPRNAEVKSTV